MNQRSTFVTAAICGVALMVVVGILLTNFTRLGKDDLADLADRSPGVMEPRPAAAGGMRPTSDSPAEVSEKRGMSAFSEAVMRILLRALAADQGALKNEVVLRFKDEAAYRDFLASRLADGVRILGSTDGLNAVRLGFDRYSNLAGLLDGLDGGDISADANFLVTVPLPPGSPESPGAGEGAVPFGRGALEALGIDGDNQTFGQGVKVAVLDSGVQEHSVFEGTSVREWDMVLDANGAPVEIDPSNGHGTAVASIIASSDPRLPGVAPAAEILSYRILDNEGFTSSFTLSEAIVSAVDNGASIINVSLGSSGNSGVVQDAVNYAIERGALVVASAGNEGTGQVSYPAALDGVIAVGANDARGEHLDFSNYGDAMVGNGIAAPGYEVTAAWPDEMGVNFSGTSASAPHVSGAIAAVMSENPGMTAQQAYDALVYHANEAGAPGDDPQHGVGNLNIGRVLNADTPGISDVAVASYHYDPQFSDGAVEYAQVVVENRGTTPLHNVAVEIDSGAGASRTYNVSYLDAGDVSVIDAPLDTSSGAISVSANARLEGDRNAADNLVQRVILFEE